MDMQKYSYGYADMDIELRDLGLVGGNNKFLNFDRFFFKKKLIIIFPMPFPFKFSWKKTATKTKILPKAGKVNF